MFAGKTTELIRRYSSAVESGHRTRVFKPRRDVRYDPDAIVTHGGVSIAACPVEGAARILVEAIGAEFVLIDEAHFFGSALVEPTLSLVGAGVGVVIAGLERDHRGEPFEPFPRLLCEADTVVKLTCPCARCGASAVHSQRLIDSRERIVVGGAESYEPRCRSCFVPGRPSID